MQQDHVIAVNSEQDSRNSLWQMSSDFPQIFIDFSDERHSHGPSKLNGLDVFPDFPLVVMRQFFEPLPDRLIAGS